MIPLAGSSNSQRGRMSSWTQLIRALPLSVDDNDVIKPDYLEVNLNNSRQIMVRLDQLARTSSENVLLMKEVNEKLSVLKSVQKKLEWLE